MSVGNPVHWADFTARRILKERGQKEQYVVAAGLTPSGVVHFGNFREVITADFVARALRDLGHSVRFILSWDDYDTFRKIPADLLESADNPQDLQKYLFRPIVDTPDPYGEYPCYAARFQKQFEGELNRVGVELEPLYQAKRYRAGAYAEQLLEVIEKRHSIREVLNRARSKPHGEAYLPVNVYCEKCHTDHCIEEKEWREGELFYHCLHCDHRGRENPRQSSRLKLPWRVDWPMRWAFERVDFEPGGKDHSAEGGSFTTAKEIVALLGGWAPVYLGYDFVSIRGGGGKMSSSQGGVVTISDLLQVYEPEMLRWIFASYKPNVDFSVSFDLDVIKTYEDFDRQERLAYAVESGNAKKVAMARRVFELSQIVPVGVGQLRPEDMPVQPSFRHLTNILQIHQGDMGAARKHYQDKLKTPRDERRFVERSRCALYWLEHHAPEDFKFALNQSAPAISLEEKQRSFLSQLRQTLEREWQTSLSDQGLHEIIYQVLHQCETEPKVAFPWLYQLLISKKKGPRLANLFCEVGRERILKLLSEALS